jgi:hypothetical protein
MQFHGAADRQRQAIDDRPDEQKIDYGNVSIGKI